jgi:hypothetical protein
VSFMSVRLGLILYVGSTIQWMTHGHQSFRTQPMLTPIKLVAPMIKSCTWSLVIIQVINLEIFQYTVKPVYNGHPWGLKKAAVRQRCLIKLRFRLAVDDSNWPLLTGGRCSQVVVRSGLTVPENWSWNS